MVRSQLFRVLVLLLLICSACEKNDSNEEKEIRQKAKSFEDAFNRKDVKALSALWSDKAQYTEPESGETLVGKDAIEKEYADAFKEGDQRKLNIQINSIQFPKSNQAVEQGIAIVNQGDEVISKTAYQAFYEKQQGNWLLMQVREVNFQDHPDQYEHLKQLEWLVGEWVDKDEDSTFESRFDWDKYKNFLTQHFSVTVEGQFDLEGRQVIGWDPIKKQIRSWIFDSDGGFGKGTWQKKGDSWFVEMSQTLADGRRTSSINIYTPIDQNSYKWESTGREVDGDLLPNIGPIVVERKKK